MKSILQNRNFQVASSNLKVSFKNKMKIVESKTIMIVLVLASFLFSTQHVFSQTTSNYNFNTAGELNAYFNRNNTSPTVTQSTNTGIGGTGAINLVPAVNAVFVAKQGFALGSIGSTYSCSTFFQSVGNSGYGGFGVTTNPSAAYVANASPNNGIGISVHGGGYIFNNNSTTSSGNWPTSSNWSGTDLLNGGSPDKWYQVVMTITRTATDDFDVEIKVYSANANGTLIRVAPDATLNNTFTNTTMGGASTLYSYFAFGGNRIHNFDDYSTTLVGTTFTSMITTGGNLSAFNSCNGLASAEQSFSVSGIGLTDDLVITPPTGFEVSTTSGSGFASSVSIPHSSSIVNSTLIYIRLTNSASGSPSGNVVCSSTGVTSQNVAASGTVNNLPTISLGSVSSVLNSATSFDLPFTSTTGSPNQYSISTIAPTPMSSFSAVNNASLSSSPLSIAIPASANNTYNFNATVRNSFTGCVSAANNFTVTVSSTPSLIPPGNALALDGSNDYVNCGNNASVQLSQGTIEAWIKTPNAGNLERAILVKQGAYGLFLADNVLQIYVWGSSNPIINTGINLADNRWHHVALSFNSGVNNGSVVYVDGAAVLTTTITVDNQGQELAIGAGQTWPLAQNFTGSIDEVRVWNTIRTPLEIMTNSLNSISASSTGLVAYYNFDNGIASGTNTGLNILTDLTSNGNNGTLNNFDLTGSSSNWIESYAMVVPIFTTATSITNNSFIVNWSAPAIGTVDNGYRLTVSTSPTFATQIAGSPFTASGTSKTLTGLNPGTTYYYKVSADKTSVTGNGGNSQLNISTTSGLIDTTGTLNAFASCIGNVSAVQSFSINGAGLTTDITVTAPTGFQISTSSSSGFGSSLVLAPAFGIVNSTPIYVRLASNATGSPSGNIVCTSTGADDKIIAVSGTVNALPTFTATKTSYNGADLSCAGISDGKITITNVTGITPFEYSKNNGSVYQPSNIFASLGEDPYSIKVKDSLGCISNATVVTIASVNPISASAISNTPVCAGTPLVLSGSALGGTGSYTYSWTGPNNYASDTTNSDTTTISVATLAMNGLFTLQVRDANNCAYNVSTNVLVKPSPTFSSNAAPVANTICEGTSTTITCTNGATTLNPAVFTTAYSNNFSSSIGNAWTFPAINPVNVPTIQTYNGGEVLGYLSNQQAKLNLTNLPTHDSITVDFDLYIHDTWDGNSTVSGPDMFRVILDNDTALNTTFSNETWNSTTQSYPNNFSASNASFTGSLTRTLPTACNFGGGSLSAKYHITKKIAHTATTLAMILEASGLENICNESWSIDNVTVQYRSQSSNSNIAWTNPSVNSNSITVSPIVNTYYKATLDGCSDSIQIFVNPTPRAGFTINTVNQCVTGNSYDFTDTTILAGGGAMTYAWTMTGAATTSANTQNVTGNTYASHGNYNVRLVATSVVGNCSDVRGRVTKTVNVSPRVQIAQSSPNPICVGNSVRLTANQVLGGSTALVYTPTYTNNFETAVGSAWTFPAIVPANVPTIQSYNGQNVLGYLTNQKAQYNQTGLATHDYVKVEFDLYLHDSWDGNSTDSIGGSLIGKDIWKMKVNGSDIINTTFSNFSYRTQAYPGNIPAVNLNGTDAVSNTLPTLCNHSGGALSSVYRISKIIPHTSGSFNLELEALGLEELCNESWSIDNFNVELGVNTATPTLLSACNGLPVSGGPVVYTVNNSNNFQSSIGSAWSFPAISPANEPSLKGFNGDSVLGFLTNQQAVYTQSGLSSHEYVKVEFDLYLHDTWDGNDVSTGVDAWKMDVDGSNVINTTFSNFSYRTQAYPNNAPFVNANFTGAVNSSLPARCNLGGGAPSSKYRISKIVPHNASTISIVLEALGLEELCNESWSIDNFQLSLGAGSAPVSSATWNGGTTTGATTCFVDITPTASTDYTVTIGACTSPITNIDVRPAPSPAFTITNASCSKTVSFTNNNIEANVTYEWNFGDGTTTYSGNIAPNHIYSAVGTYTVTLSASISGGCTQTTTRTIKIADAPTSGISFTGGTGCGNSVQFTNTSIIPAGNTATYLWSFGETPISDTSTAENPLHSYIADGNYSVSLIVSTGTNCSAISFVSVNALAAITGNQAIFTATVGSTCGNYVTTTNSSTGTNNQYLWNFGDGNTSNEVTPTHYYTTGGFKTITLTILNGVGCATTSNKIVNISNNTGANGRVGVDFAITPTNSQVLLTNDFGFEPTFTNYPNNNPVVYCAGAPTWTYGDNTGSNSTIIYSKKYNAAGTYTVRIVQQTTNTGCFAEASKTVTVLPNPLMQLSPITFKDGETAILNNNLSTGIGSVKTENNDLAMYPNPNKGSFKVKLHNLKVADGEILVVDMLGREIYKTTFNNKSGVDLVEINNLNAAPGTYHLIISSNGNVAARKPFVIIAE